MKPSARLARIVTSESRIVTKQIRPILQRVHPVTRGCVLADLLAEYFVSNFHARDREEQIELWLEVFSSMMEITEDEREAERTKLQ